MRIKSFRVRVRRSIEDWVSVSALTASAAEIEAQKVPGVLSVFSQSAIPDDEPQQDPLTIEGE